MITAFDKTHFEQNQGGYEWDWRSESGELTVVKLFLSIYFILMSTLDFFVSLCGISK